MNSDERTRITTRSAWYLEEQLDFDKRLIRYRYQSLKPHLAGPNGLELGPPEGEMTQYLLQDFDQLTVVDGAAELLAHIPDAPNLSKVHALFEDYSPDGLFNTIVMEHILEHVEKPQALLNRARKWLAPGGRLLVGVPNALSIHRLVAVKMGLLKKSCELNQRDLALGHRRVYAPRTLRGELESAQLCVVELGGVFFKPISNKQIEDHWTDQMIQGFYELGKDFQENAAEIYAICESL